MTEPKCGCCERPFRKRDTPREQHLGTVLMYKLGLCFACQTCDDNCKIVANGLVPQWLTLCRWVPDGESWVPELVTGLRRGRQGRGPWRLQVGGVVRSYPRSEWMEVEE